MLNGGWAADASAGSRASADGGADRDGHDDQGEEGRSDAGLLHMPARGDDDRPDDEQEAREDDDRRATHLGPSGHPPVAAEGHRPPPK